MTGRYMLVRQESDSYISHTHGVLCDVGRIVGRINPALRRRHHPSNWHWDGPALETKRLGARKARQARLATSKRLGPDKR